MLSRRIIILYQHIKESRGYHDYIFTNITIIKRTNKGNLLESIVKDTLKKKGFTIVNYIEWKKDIEKYGNELLLENVPYTTIYEHRGKTEYSLISLKYNLNIRIECKWQHVSGSVDEKLPYLYLNVLKKCPKKQ